MYVSTLVLIIASILVVVLFYPDMFPYCSCCRKVKFRALFKIYRASGSGILHLKNISVCRKCCRKYYIATLSDYDNLETIRRKLEAELDLHRK